MKKQRSKDARSSRPKPRNVKTGAAGNAQPVDLHERGRDFLTKGELADVLKAAKAGKHGKRDHLMVLLMVRHGLRVSEATGLKLADIDLKSARLWVRRLKNGLSTEHIIEGDELRAIRSYLGSRDDTLPWLFISERRGQLTRQAVNYILNRAAERAGLANLYPHMLRHTCGHLLADRDHNQRLIQDYLGHRNASNTVRYTRVSARRFRDLWR